MKSWPVCFDKCTTVKIIHNANLFQREHGSLNDILHERSYALVLRLAADMRSNTTSWSLVAASRAVSTSKKCSDTDNKKTQKNDNLLLLQCSP